MVRRSLIPLLLAFSAAAVAPVFADPAPAADSDPTGQWLTSDGGAVVTVTRCGNAICGRFAGFRAVPPPRDWQGQSECRLEFIHQLQPDPNTPGQWQGSITDPTDGSNYNANISMSPDGTLHLRGYLGISLLGRTEIWTRYTGSLSYDCRMQ